MNQAILRFVLTMNTSHEDFMRNLLNVIKYVMFCNKEECSTDKIRDMIKEDIGLTFTEQEIRRVISLAIKKGEINEISKEKYVLSDNQINKINQKDGDKLEKIIQKFAQIYDINTYTNDEIYTFIVEYVFWYMDNNIQILLAMFQNKEIVQVDDEYKCKDEVKEIINKFVDWENEEKNEILYKIIAFAVDYCKLTVKKGKNAFGNFFVGKKFYLDANIIFRLIGINNEERQKVTKEFIERCREEKIKIVYTNITKDEVYTAIDYNIKMLEKTMKKVKFDPEKLKILLPEYQMNIDLYSMYYRWAKTNNDFGNLENFKTYLKDEFIKIVMDFSMEEVILNKEEEQLINDYVGELIQYKQKESKYAHVNPEIVMVDVKNLLYLKKLRNKQKSINAWDIKEYMISADHKFAQWTMDKYPQVAPYVSLPSVWYSLILKIGGRSKNDYSSFAEFIKLRYCQESDTLVGSVISHISEATDDKFLQNKIVDKLIESNQLRLNEKEELNEEEIKNVVIEAKNDVLEEIRTKGYNEGMNEGKNIGEEEGKIIGQAVGKKEGILQGKKEGREDTINCFVNNSYEKIRAVGFVVKLISILGVCAAITVTFYLWYIVLYKNQTVMNALEVKLGEYKEVTQLILLVLGVLFTLLKNATVKLFDEQKMKKWLKKHYEKKLRD